ELYRNSCADGKPGQFTNVSGEAGILRDAGYGLGVVAADLNDDGWPDIYVSNDGIPNDAVYINNRKGGFTNVAATALKHSSQAGMGVDIADFNNDGRPDIVQADMMPSDPGRRKRMSGYMTESNLQDTRSRGFRVDYSENSLQLNNGVTADGTPVFSEVARMAGVAHTDWSWSALFADFDNDGYKDIFIGNGYPKAVNDLDYMSGFFAAQQRGDQRAARRLLKDLPGYQFSNFVFRNNGDLTFTDESRAWGMDRAGYSYGAAYADLNNDGALDLVVSNIDGPASIYQNVAPKDDAHHYLEVRLVGEGTRARTAGIGARLILTSSGKKQYFYYSPYRGFMSTMDERAHFGLGTARRADTLEIDWPDGRRQVLSNVAADRLLLVKQAETSMRSDSSGSRPAVLAGKWFEPMNLRGLNYRQAVATQPDYSVQSLLPYRISSHGPPIAVSDVNGDGLEDLFVGGGNGVAGQMFLQRKDGSFARSPENEPWQLDKDYDDWGATFLDANGDGRPDLYVASGGYRVAPGSPLLQDRLYVNHGDGKFVRDSVALPPMLTSKSVVRVGDFNGDGKPDLFVGGRLTPRNYPYPTRSYILRNDGGRFTDVTEALAPELVKPGGMITDAAWSDFDGDGHLDLVTAGEWMPIRFFRNSGQRLTEVTATTGLPSLRGWWYSLAVADVDNDHRPDIIAGNLGLNYSYTTSRDTTFGVYAGSFSGSQTSEIVLTQKVDGKEYPLAGLAQLGREIYQLGITFPTNGSFSTSPLQQAFSSAQLSRALHYEADTFASAYLHNDGGGKFTASPLPPAAQIAPIKGIVVTDVDSDGNVDLVVAGNLYDAEPNIARADAGNGLWLKGDGKGHFTPVSPVESGLLAPLNVSGLALLTTPAGKALLVANTGDSLQVFRVKKH
ncbi:MAG: VCBS repeat-containing protein, partial [Gemmatimonadaceae bacterium]